ncbi:MAG: hypothetical protein HY258_02740 [Chloroflexi bacterium]|nr:hypothetical protein [Chloroflexota bacterium]
MSKASAIILAILVTLLAWLFCSVTFITRDSPSYLGALIFILALGIGVGSYFLFDFLQKRSFANQEKTAHEILDPVLPPGETLLAYVHGFTGPGRTGMILLFGILGDALFNAGRRKWYYVGITKQYLVLVQVNGKKPAGVQQVVRRNEVGHFAFEASGFKEPRLALQFTVEPVELLVEGNMVKRAKEMDALWHSAA